MTDQVFPLATFYKPGWEQYQHALVQTIAPLSSEQLALSLGPQQRSIGELLEHMIGARFNWFYLWMGEGDPSRDWSDDEDTSEPTAYKAASLVAMFEKRLRIQGSGLSGMSWNMRSTTEASCPWLLEHMAWKVSIPREDQRSPFLTWRQRIVFAMQP